MNLYVRNLNGASGLPVNEENIAQVFDKLVRRSYERGGRIIHENAYTSLIEVSDNVVWWLEDEDGYESEGGSGIPSTDHLKNEFTSFL
jgi:hypothetical protein